MTSMATSTLSTALAKRAATPAFTPPSPTKSKPQFKKGFSTDNCRACAALVMDPRYYPHKRSLSPGAKLVIPGRSSAGTVGSAYDSYSPHTHSARDDHRHGSLATPRKPTGVIPISTEVIYKDGSSSSNGGSRDLYSGRPRRSTATETDPSAPPLRSRPAIVQNAIVRPGSPLSRSYEPRDTYVKPNTTVRREPKSTKLYSVDNSSAKLIAETEHRDLPRRERAGYHLTGQSHRPSVVDESAWSTIEPAAMYNETEPVRRSRRGSVDRVGTLRPYSVIEPSSYGHQHRSSRDYGPPPTSRQLHKVNDLGRSTSVREPTRSSSRDRHGSYDNYGEPDPYNLPLRSATTMPVVVHSSSSNHRNSRDLGYHQDDYEDPRESRRPTRQFTDDGVTSRGFGIRTGSIDRYGGSNSSSVEARPRQADIYPASSALYANEPLVKMPSTTDYLPPGSDDRREREWERDQPKPRDYEREKPKDRGFERERDKPKDRDYERERPKERDYERSERGKDRGYESDTRTRDRGYESDSRPRDRTYEKPRERDTERHHHRRHSRDLSVTRGEKHDLAVPAAAAAGVAGVAAGAVMNKHRSERKQDSDEERSRRPRAEPKDREEEERSRKPRGDPREREEEERTQRPRTDPSERGDDRERTYAEKDRSEKKSEIQAKEPELSPEEDYRRRIQMAQLELSRQQSNEDERSDSDRERRRRRDREERERERERESRESRDRGSERRRGSDEDKALPAPPVEIRSRPREASFDEEARHNRAPEGRGTTERGLTQEPDSIPGAYPRDPRSSADSMGPPPGQSSSEIETLPIPDLVPRSKSADPGAAERAERERRVTIVEPSKKEPTPIPPVKSILRKPTEKFPEHPDPVREGVAPLKERLKKDTKDIPSGAKWTKIDRRLVNPQALEEKGERFEERQDCVIVLKVLTKDEIQAFANRTAEIREEREEKYNSEKRRRSSHRHSYRDDDNTSDEDGKGRKHSSSRKHRDDEPREHRSSKKDKEYDDDDYTSENDAAKKAIEDSRNGRSRREEDAYMSGGLGR